MTLISRVSKLFPHNGVSQYSFVVVISTLLKRHSKAKRRAPAYSRALRQIGGIIQRIVCGRLRSGCQRVRWGSRLAVKAGARVIRRRVGRKHAGSL